MNKKAVKISFIGAGSVGMSCLYACINQNLASQYGIIDVFAGARDGNVLDLEDVRAAVYESYTVKGEEYSDLHDSDLIVISAGLPQKPGQTRLDMVEGNLKVIKDIAENVKASGFKGITIIISNPVDVMTQAYIKYTGFDPKRVLGSGTILDTARLQHAIGTDLGVDIKNVQGYVLGEHGDSSLVAFSSISVAGTPLSQWKSSFTESNYEADLEHPVSRKAYEIINRKRATFYGIGANISKLIRAIIKDTNSIIVAGALMHGEYGHSDVVFGSPCVVNGNGIARVIEIPLNDKEKAKLANSVSILKSYVAKI